MDVILDGKRLDPSASRAPTVEALIAGALPAGDDRMITAAQLDGQSVSDEHLAALLAGPLAGAGRLELTSQSTSLLAAAVLGQAAGALEETADFHRPIAEHLAAGRQGEGMELLARCLTAWELADRALRQAAQLARLDLSAATPLPSTGEGGPSGPGEGPAVQIAACRDVLGRIQRAMQVGDFVDVADRVEHELPGLTDGWQTLLVQLQQSLLAGRKSLEAPAPEC